MAVTDNYSLCMVSLEENGMNRRNVLRTVGAVTIAGGGLTFATSPVAAHEWGEVVFCGCSQVCACGTGEATVIVAHETDDGFTCEGTEVVSCCDTDTQNCEESDLPTCRGNDFEFCYEVEDGKIVAVENGDGQIIRNPNDPWNCAGDALVACGLEDEPPGQSGGPCGDAFLRTCGQDSSGDDPGRGREGRGRSE